MSPLPRLQSALGSLRLLRPSWSANWGTTPLGWLGRLAARLPVLSSRTGWLFYTLACFVFFVVLTFPSGVFLPRLVTSLTQGSGVRVGYMEGDCTWLAGCVLRDLSLESLPLGVTGVRLSRLTLQPSVVGLLVSSRPWPLTFSAELYGGAFDGTLRQVVGGMSAQLALHHITLDQWPFPAPWGQGRVAGSVTADGDLLGNPADLYSLQGTFTVTLTDGVLRAGTLNGFPVPALQTVQAHLRVSLAAGRLEISELRLSADGVEASLVGGITLRTPVARSGLDLQLTTHITGSPPPAVKTFLSLLPASQTTSGERRASITGSLATPVVR